MVKRYTFILLVMSLVVVSCSRQTVGSDQTPTLPPSQWQELPEWAKSPENPTILPPDECNNPLAIVNRANLLPVEDCDQPLTSASESGINSSDKELISVLIIGDLKAMFDAAEVAGYPLKVSSGWRDREYQERVFDDWVSRGNGDENYANTYTYHGGASTHHLGTVVDLSFGENGYESGSGLDQAETKTYQWLLKHSWQYGCVLEYPEGKQDVTGLWWEPWHYRCGIPVQAAKTIMTTDFTLAEWLEENSTDVEK